MAPTLVYWPVSGRGGLIRLIAGYGGVELNDAPTLPEGTTHCECGSAGTLPLLIDGDFKINESVAIASYVASIAPKLSGLTAQQRAKDMQFTCLLETILPSLAKHLFGEKKKEDFQAAADKYFPVVEGILPETGFVNGLDYPTVADLVTVILCEGYMPFGASYKLADIDVAKQFPKLKAHADRTLAVEGVASTMAKASYKAALPGF